MWARLSSAVVIDVGHDDFIQALTTPYGTTTFRHEPPFNSARRIETTDPAGGTERIEYHTTHPELPGSVASSECRRASAPTTS